MLQGMTRLPRWEFEQMELVIVQGLLNAVLAFMGVKRHDFVVVRQKDLDALAARIGGVDATVTEFKA